MNEIKIDSLVYDDEQMNLLYKEMGKNIANLREREGLTISRMAELVNLAPGHLFKIMYNQSKIGTASLFKIVTAFNLSLYDIVPLEEKPRARTNGERFEDLVQNCDLKTINLIFDVVEDITKYNKTNKKNK